MSKWETYFSWKKEITKRIIIEILKKTNNELFFGYHRYCHWLYWWEKGDYFSKSVSKKIVIIL